MVRLSGVYLKRKNRVYPSGVPSFLGDVEFEAANPDPFLCVEVTQCGISGSWL